EHFLVDPQGFKPRLIGSEPTVLPLNERAIQVENGSCRLGREPKSAACLSVRMSRQWVNSHTSRIYSSRRTSSGFCPKTRWLASQPAATVSAAVAQSAAKFHPMF